MHSVPPTTHKRSTFIVVLLIAALIICIGWVGYTGISVMMDAISDVQHQSDKASR